MKTIKYKNGYEGTYDETIRVGDLVTTCWKGFFRVVEIHPRFQTEYVDGRLVEMKGVDGTPLFMVKREFNSAGITAKQNKAKPVDAAYCRKATEKIPEFIKELDTQKKSLKKILDAEHKSE